jgi:hypothetical protein
MTVLYLIFLIVFLIAFGGPIFSFCKKIQNRYQKLQRNKLAQKQQLLLKASLQNDFDYFYRLHSGNSQQILAELVFQSYEKQQAIQQLLEEYNRE